MLVVIDRRLLNSRVPPVLERTGRGTIARRSGREHSSGATGPLSQLHIPADRWARRSPNADSRPALAELFLGAAACSLVGCFRAEPRRGTHSGPPPAGRLRGAHHSTGNGGSRAAPRERDGRHGAAADRPAQPIGPGAHHFYDGGPARSLPAPTARCRTTRAGTAQVAAPPKPGTYEYLVQPADAKGPRAEPDRWMVTTTAGVWDITVTIRGPVGGHRWTAPPRRSHRDRVVDAAPRRPVHNRPPGPARPRPGPTGQRRHHLGQDELRPPGGCRHPLDRPVPRTPGRALVRDPGGRTYRGSTHDEGRRCRGCPRPAGRRLRPP